MRRDGRIRRRSLRGHQRGRVIKAARTGIRHRSARTPGFSISPRTGKQAWKFTQFDVTDAGILTTASNLLFTGGREGYFYALDARDGKELWKVNLGGQIVMAPITYQIDGKQYVSV